MNRKEYAVSTVLIKMNWKLLIQHATNKKFWQNNFVVYEIGKIKVSLYIASIDVRYNTIKLGVRYGSDELYLWFVIPMAEDQYNESLFNKQLCGYVCQAIQELEKSRVHNYSAWKEALDADNDNRLMLEGIAEKFLDENGITNENIRDAYTTAFVDENCSNLADEVWNKYVNHVMTREYLMAAMYFDREDSIEFYSNILKNKNTIQFIDICKEIRESIAEMKTETFEQAMQDKLIAI